MTPVIARNGLARAAEKQNKIRAAARVLQLSDKPRHQYQT